MAKIVIAGDAVIFTSSLKLNDIKTVAKYRPDELVLKGGENGKEPIFAVSAAEGTGKINQYGVTFTQETRDGAKLATLTVLAKGVGDGGMKEWVADQYGKALIYLNKLEAKLPGVLAEISAEKDSVMRNITVAQ